MPIKVACQCGQQFAAKDELAGKRVKCPKCGGVLVIPQPRAAAAKGSDKSLSELLDDAGMRAGIRRCAGCGAEMADEAVLCVMCGFDTRRGHRLKTRIGTEIEIDDEDLGDLPTHGHDVLDRAERQMARDKLEQKRMSKGTPWWMLLLAFLGLVAFAVSMVSLPQESVMENSALVLQIAGGLLIGLYVLQLVIAAFKESLLMGLLCLSVVGTPVFVIARWDRVSGMLIFIGVGLVIMGAGFLLLWLAPMFKPDPSAEFVFHWQLAVGSA